MAVKARQESRASLRRAAKLRSDLWRTRRLCTPKKLRTAPNMCPTKSDPCILCSTPQSCRLDRHRGRRGSRPRPQAPKKASCSDSMKSHPSPKEASKGERLRLRTIMIYRLQSNQKPDLSSPESEPMKSRYKALWWLRWQWSTAHSGRRNTPLQCIRQVCRIRFGTLRVKDQISPEDCETDSVD